jgi:hypothetical protein
VQIAQKFLGGLTKAEGCGIIFGSCSKEQTRMARPKTHYTAFSTGCFIFIFYHFFPKLAAAFENGRQSPPFQTGLAHTDFSHWLFHFRC